MIRRMRLGLLVLAIGCLILGGTGTAEATRWKTVKPPKAFVAYAKHAKRHGIQAWYPSRIPVGYAIGRPCAYEDSRGYPDCTVEFWKGARAFGLYNGVAVGATRTWWKVKTAWGPTTARCFRHNVIRLTGRVLARDQYAYTYVIASLASGDDDGPPTVPWSEMRTVAKYMRKVP